MLLDPVVDLRELGVALVEHVVAQGLDAGVQQRSDGRCFGVHRANAVRIGPALQYLVWACASLDERLQLQLVALAEDEAQTLRHTAEYLSLIHISEPTRLLSI